MSSPAHAIGSFCFAELHTPQPGPAAHFYYSLLSWNLRIGVVVDPGDASFLIASPIKGA